MGVLDSLISYLKKTKTAFVKKNKREPNYYTVDDKRIMKEEANKLMALKPMKPVVGVQNPNKKVLGLNWVRQPDIYTCGPTMVNRLLKAIGIPSTIARLRILMKTSTNKKNPGTTPQNLRRGAVAFANQKGITIQYKEVPILSLAQIKTYIDKGIPIGAHGKTTQCMDYNGEYGHYITISGYDMTDKKVYILDSSRSAKWITYNCLVSFIRNHGAAKPMKAITK